VRIRLDLFGIDFLILQGLKSTNYSPKIQGNFVHYFTYYLGEFYQQRRKFPS
jgi:hypothetical protein